MKPEKYDELIKLLIEHSDCVAFEIEAFESLGHKITDEEIKQVFEMSKKDFEEDKHIGKKYIHYKNLVLKKDALNKKYITSALNSLKSIEDDILFKNLTLEFGTREYLQESKNLIVGFQISDEVKKYLFKAKKLENWWMTKPSNLIFYQNGKCIFQSITHDKVIYTSNKELFDKINKLKYHVVYKEASDFVELKYPYDLNDNDGVKF